MNIELTDEAKKAIRTYIVTITAVPGILVTIVAAFVGYSFKSTQDLAKSSAVLETRVQAQGVITEIQRDISNLSAESKTALALAKRDQENIQASFRRMKTTLEALDGVKDITGVIERIESTLDQNIDFQNAVALKIRPSEILMSDVISTPGDCQSPRKQTIGNFPALKFCALSQNQVYRHGQNKGAISCQVAIEQNQWVLIANGPTHECGSGGGSTSGQCQAICWK